MSGHNFTADGKLDLMHSEEAERRFAPKLAQLHQESRWQAEYFHPRKSTRISRLMSVSWLSVLSAKIDLLHYASKHYMEVFK